MFLLSARLFRQEVEPYVTELHYRRSKKKKEKQQQQEQKNQVAALSVCLVLVLVDTLTFSYLRQAEPLGSVRAVYSKGAVSPSEEHLPSDKLTLVAPEVFLAFFSLLLLVGKKPQKESFPNDETMFFSLI